MLRNSNTIVMMQEKNNFFGGSDPYKYINKKPAFKNTITLNLY